MKQLLTSSRRTAQWLLISRAGLLRPWILMNSLPKSGTHLAKAILNGAGLRFVGHVGERELHHLSLSKVPNRLFTTAHVTQPVTNPGIKLLIYRDPIDVALSMAIYIRGRVDHPRRPLLSAMPLGEAVELIFTGAGSLEPLAQRFRQMHDWAVASEARAIDFATFKQNPLTLLSMISAEDADLDAIHREIGCWNPTKRSGPFEGELKIKQSLRQSSNHRIQSVYDVYKEIKSLT